MAADLKDEMLALPKTLPLAIRAQAYVQGRSAEEIDSVSGPTGHDAGLDFQSPYLIKLLSSAPLSEQITLFTTAYSPRRGPTAKP